MKNIQLVLSLIIKAIITISVCTAVATLMLTAWYSHWNTCMYTMAYSREAFVSRLQWRATAPSHWRADLRSAALQSRQQRPLSSTVLCQPHTTKTPSTLAVHRRRQSNTRKHGTRPCCRETSTADHTAYTASVSPVHPPANTKTKFNQLIKT